MLADYDAHRPNEIFAERGTASLIKRTLTASISETVGSKQ
jgi:hypothetical protein